MQHSTCQKEIDDVVAFLKAQIHLDACVAAVPKQDLKKSLGSAGFDVDSKLGDHARSTD